MPRGIPKQTITLRVDPALLAEFRAVVLLVDVEEFAYKEASEILWVPIGTVMSRLSRGRGLLRKRLAELARSYGIAKDARKKGLSI